MGCSSTKPLNLLWHLKRKTLEVQNPWEIIHSMLFFHRWGLSDPERERQRWQSERGLEEKEKSRRKGTDGSQGEGPVEWHGPWYDVMWQGDLQAACLGKNATDTGARQCRGELAGWRMQVRGVQASASSPTGPSTPRVDGWGLMGFQDGCLSPTHRPSRSAFP